jgi:hypothetical protein
MADEDSFDIYGDDDPASPASPTQSGPKKRLRRERSSSAPPLSANNEDGEDDGETTPRGKKVKEEVPVSLGDDEDPFSEYDTHVSTTTHHVPSSLLSSCYCHFCYLECCYRSCYFVPRKSCTRN